MTRQELVELLDPPNTYPILAANILGISIKTLYKLSYKHDISFPRPPKGFNKFFLEQRKLQDIENIRFKERTKDTNK